MSSKSEDVRPRAALCASAAQSSVDKWWLTQKWWFIRKDNKDETSELQIQHRLKKRASSECVHSSFVESSINLVPLLILQQNPPTLTFGPGQRRGIFRFMFYDVVTQGSSQNKTNTLPTIWMVTSCSFCSWLVENSGIEPLTSCMPCKRSPERYRNTPPRKSCVNGYHLALIRYGRQAAHYDTVFRKRFGPSVRKKRKIFIPTWVYSCCVRHEKNRSESCRIVFPHMDVSRMGYGYCNII